LLKSIGKIYSATAADEVAGAKKSLSSSLARAAMLPEVSVAVTAGQVMYAVLQLHCQQCCLPLHICKFPGCGIIRGRAYAEGGDIWSPRVDSVDDRATYNLPTGVSPLDIAVKEYLLAGSRMLNSFPKTGAQAPAVIDKPEMLTTEESTGALGAVLADGTANKLPCYTLTSQLKKK